MLFKLKMKDNVSKAERVGSVELHEFNNETLTQLANKNGMTLIEVLNEGVSVWKISSLEIPPNNPVNPILIMEHQELKNKRPTKGKMLSIVMLMLMAAIVICFVVFKESPEERGARAYREAGEYMAPGLEKSVLKLYKEMGYRECQFCKTRNNPEASNCKACAKEMRLDHQSQDRK